MATLPPLACGPTMPAAASTINRRATFVARATKGSGGTASEEKSPLDWILGFLQKEDQFFETDPILKKVEDKGNNTTTSRGKSSVAVPPPKKNNGGFGIGGLFAKKG